MGYVGKIRDKFKDSRIRPGSSHVNQSRDDLPLDHQLTFRRGRDEEWKFKEGRIYINNTDVEEIINYDDRDVRLWCGISEALTEYKDAVLSKEGRGRSRFIAKADAVQNKVVSNMKRLYDEKTTGLCLNFGDGACLMNNFNVRAFLAMYHMRPTNKARKFLMGLKSKLALILVGRNGTTQKVRVHRVVQQLYDEVVDALGIPPIDTRYLPSSCGDKSL